MSWFENKKQVPERVESGRFELERDGIVAALDYTLDSNVLTLLETEVPEALRGSGVAGALAQSALEWAREHHRKVDVVCPYVSGYLQSHPEFADLVLR
ncbi:MAG TPA: GNAT family N-acetyltransferase [Bryobacteraceae bacterium]|nr:GNAT family N-acetyltransferase [Bryobacteraceae bacterium]